jgi:hypothetical protein
MVLGDFKIFENIFWGLNEDLNIDIQYYLNFILIIINHLILLLGVYLYYKYIELNKCFILINSFIINLILHLPSLTYVHVRMGTDTTAYINQAGQF